MEQSPTSNYNPINDGPVDKKNYGANFAVDQRIIEEGVQEHELTPPPIEIMEETPPPAPQPKKPEQPLNPELNDLSMAEKRKNAEQTYAMVMGVYSQMHVWANAWVKVGERKINRMHEEGRIDKNFIIKDPSDNSQEKLGACILAFDQSIDGKLVVDEEFKQTVKEPMIRVFMKKGVGMTDEQFILYAFATHIGKNAVIAYDLIRDRNRFINALEKIYADHRKASQQFQEQQAWQATQAQPKKEEPISPHEDVTPPQPDEEGQINITPEGESRTSASPQPDDRPITQEPNASAASSASQASTPVIVVQEEKKGGAKKRGPNRRVARQTNDRNEIDDADVIE